MTAQVLSFNGCEVRLPTVWNYKSLPFIFLCCDWLCMHILCLSFCTSCK